MMRERHAAGGCFITLEGVDGAGKSTHVAWIAQRLAASGREVVLTREPGGTALGEQLRELLLHAAMTHDSEALLMFAARREHVELVIRPALARGAYVVCDRFTDATYAYQAAGHGVPRAMIDALAAWVHQDCNPDLTFLFDVPVDVSRRRLQAAQGARADKFEREAGAYFERVRGEYLARASREPARFRIIDGTRTIPEVRGALERELAPLLAAVVGP